MIKENDLRERLRRELERDIQSGVVPDYSTEASADWLERKGRKLLDAAATEHGFVRTESGRRTRIQAIDFFVDEVGDKFILFEMNMGGERGRWTRQIDADE